MEPNPSSRHLRDLPPRSIGLFTKATILFGGFLQQFGWIFFVMGSLFSWIFIPASTVRFWFEFGKDWKETPGKIISAEPTNSAVNDVTVYRYLHSFEVNGVRFTGKSFTTGQQYQGGEEVNIRYDANNPGDSHVAGSDRAVFPAFVLFVLLFPLVGLAFIVTSVRNNWKAVKLLEIGEFTRGKMVSKEATGSEVKINNNRYPIFKYSFEFEAGGKTRTAICKTHQGWLVEDEEREIILYDRFNPDFNLVYDAAANVPAISEYGMLKPASFGKVLYLLLPLAGIALNVYFLMHNPGLIQ
jgi:hypothetical protein